MANTKIQTAKLEDFRGPFFPRKLERVQKRYRYESIRWNQQFFDAVADRLHAGKVIWHPRTTDGYTWTAGISFRLGSVRYKVLFPMTHDTLSRREGTNSDRHVALYTSENVSESQMAYAAEMFAEDFVATYRRLYEDAIVEAKKKAAISS